MWFFEKGKNHTPAAFEVVFDKPLPENFNLTPAQEALNRERGFAFLLVVGGALAWMLRG